MTSETITREDLKNVLNKVLPLKLGDVKFSSVTSIDLNNTWTAPKDGFVYVGVGWNNNASYGYCYIKDYTTGAWAGLISNANSLGGFSESTMFPVVEGHQYKVDMSNQVGSLTATYYPLVGGFDAIVSSVDHVIEEGTSGVWTYRKWNSGKAELWGNISGSVPSGWSPVGVVVQFPFTLTAYDSWSVSQGNWQISRCYLNISNTQIAIQTQSDEALTALFAFRVEGRWK